MITPLIPPAPVVGQFAVNPAAARQSGAALQPPVVEPGQSPRHAGDPAADRRQVPPPPRAEQTRSEPPLRGDRSDAADGRLGFRRPGRHGPDVDVDFDPGPRRFTSAAYEDLRAGPPRPRPSSAFLAQAIGQALDDGAGAPSPETVTSLYRQTGDAVERELLRRRLRPPPDGS